MKIWKKPQNGKLQREERWGWDDSKQAQQCNDARDELAVESVWLWQMDLLARFISKASDLVIYIVNTNNCW